MRTRERGNGSSAGTGVRSAMPGGCPHRSPSEPPRPRRAFGGPTHHRKRPFGGRRLTLTLGQAVAWSPSRRGGAMSWTVGELARLAGVTVRTLHHYDRIGLVRPSERTAAGYRSYDEHDLDRLQQVLVYRELGFPLEEVANLLEDTDAYADSRRRVATYGKDDWLRIKDEAADVERRFAEALRSGVPADSVPAMDVAEEHRQHISRWFYDCPPQMHAGLGQMYVQDERFTAHYEQVAPGLAGYVSTAVQANAARQG